MELKLTSIVLVALLFFQVQGGVGIENISLPVFNIFDPATSWKSIQQFIENLNLLSANATAFATQAKNEVQQLAESTINKTKIDVNNLVQALKKNSFDSNPIAHTVKGFKCVDQGLKSATSAGNLAVKDVVSCVTDQVNSFLSPALDLINEGKNGLLLGYNIYKNLSACGLTTDVQVWNIGPKLVCAFQQIGPAFTEVNTIISSTVKDVKALQESLTNTRNSIVRCPRERTAQLIVQFGGVVSDFGKCINAIYENTNTTTVSS